MLCGPDCESEGTQAEESWLAMPSPAVSLSMAAISVLQDDVAALQREVADLVHDLDRSLDIASVEAAEVDRLRAVLVRIRDGQCGACKRTADEDGHVDCDSRPRCYWMPIDAEREARAALAG